MLLEMVTVAVNNKPIDGASGWKKSRLVRLEINLPSICKWTWVSRENIACDRLVSRVCRNTWKVPHAAQLGASCTQN